MVLKEIKKIVENTWEGLELKARQSSLPGERIYRRIDLGKETGIRLGVTTPGETREILIELTREDRVDFSPPKWAGMGFQKILLDVPRTGTQHIRLFIEDISHLDVFVSVCVDIIETMLGVVKESHRTITLISCLEKWNRFFQKHGMKGLARESQRGLYGELFLLFKFLIAGMDKYQAIESWQGCRRNYHDFETSQIVIEVKTTISKEPRKVIINNERQLDDRGLTRLCLYTITLHLLTSDGQKLPELIYDIRSLIASDIAASALFETSLQDAGYLDVHKKMYTTGYIVKSEDSFHVREGFPRIIDMPPGTGDLSYSLVLSSCANYTLDIDSIIKVFVGGDEFD